MIRSMLRSTTNYKMVWTEIIGVECGSAVRSQASGVI